MLTARDSPASCTINSMVYAFGGAHFQTTFPQLEALGSAESLNLAGVQGGAASSWRWAPPLPSNRTSAAAAAVQWEGKAACIIAGGFYGGSSDFAYLNETLLFDGTEGYAQSCSSCYSY